MIVHEVYVVEGGAYEERDILGIYLTQEKANERKQEWDIKNIRDEAIITVWKIVWEVDK